MKSTNTTCKRNKTHSEEEKDDHPSLAEIEFLKNDGKPIILYDGSNGTTCKVKWNGESYSLKIMFNFISNDDLTLNDQKIKNNLINKEEKIKSMFEHKNDYFVSFEHCWIETLSDEVMNLLDDKSWEILNTRTALFLFKLYEKTIFSMKNEKKTLPFFEKKEDLMKFLKDTCSAIKIQKEKNIVHLNLKEKTIYYDSKKDIYKIGNFDNSFVQVEKEIYDYKPIGTKYYSPKDFSQNYEKYDIFSLGVVCFHFFSDRKRNMEKQLYLTDTECKDKFVRDLINEMLLDDSEKRCDEEFVLNKIKEYWYKEIFPHFVRITYDFSESNERIFPPEIIFLILAFIDRFGLFLDKNEKVFEKLHKALEKMKKKYR